MTQLLIGCGERELVKVGKAVIKEKTLSLRMEINEVLGVKSDRESVLRFLVQTAIYSEVLRQNDQDLSLSALLRQEQRLLRHPSKKNSCLKVKGEFSKEEYRRGYLLPSLVRRAIYYDLYLKSTKLHLGSFAKSRRIRHQIQQNRLRKLAFKHGHPFFLLKIDGDNILTWTKLERSGRQKINKGADYPTEEVTMWKKRIPKLPMGRVASRTFDHGTNWIIAKRIPVSNRGDRLLVEVLLVPKKPYVKWLDSIKRKVLVERLK